MYKPAKILFICKNRSYGTSYSDKYDSFGLTNSANLLSTELNRIGFESKVVVVIDNNCIDREVSEYKPTHVIIEALWVVPSKFPILMKLHPKVKWIVRIHSKLPFLAHEGIAMQWLKEYAKLPEHFSIAANNSIITDDLNKVIGPCLYLPNIYSTSDAVGYRNPKSEFIDVGCFGSIRPMKNHLIQAFAAIEFAEHLGKKLRFHVNATRTEQKGEQVLKNLQNLFPIRDHILVEHSWMPHKDFLKFIATMDIGMQVSMSETFNIVTADFVKVGVPVIVSDEIDWLPFFCKADPNSRESIYQTLRRIWWLRCFTAINAYYLASYNSKAKQVWKHYLKYS